MPASSPAEVPPIWSAEFFKDLRVPVALSQIHWVALP
jgi:hypothetical protein